MLFTLMYIAMTIRTSLRFSVIKHNIRKILTDRYAVSFYTTSAGGNVLHKMCGNLTSGLDSPDASRSTNVSCCFWYGPHQRGCLVYPVQRKNLAEWTSIPERVKLLQATDRHPDLLPPLSQQQNDAVQVVVSLEQSLDRRTEASDEFIMLRHFGRFLAWNRSDRGVQVLLETDAARLFQLVVATFGHDRFLLDNGRLQLVQLDSVQTFAEPKTFDESSCSSKALEGATRHTTDGWLNALMEANYTREDPIDPIQTAVGIQPDIISSNDIKISIEAVEGTVISSQSKADLLSSGSNSRNRSQLDLTDGLVSTLAHDEPSGISTNGTAGSEDGIEPEICIDTAVDKNPIKTPLPIVAPDTPKNVEIAQPVRAGKLPVVENAPVEKSPPAAVKVVASNGSSKSPLKSPEKTLPPPSPPSPSPVVQKPVLAVANEDPPAVKPKATRSLRKSSFPSSRLRLGGMPAGIATKPPNILVHSDSSSTMEYVIATMNSLLEPNTYTIYPITTAQAMASNWQQSTALIIVAGTLDLGVRKVLLDYFLHGGIVFSLCSDLLDIILPDSKTAEIRERELVSFSYRKWKQIKMLHHIFCYQLSPAKKQFSLESEETSTLLPVSYVDVQDISGKQHSLTVEILAQEETWNTPSILEAHNRKTGGRAIFSQIHLELDPSQFQTSIESTDDSLQNSNQLRYEILGDLLGGRIGLKLRDKSTAQSDSSLSYKNAFFLGKHEAKVDVLGALKDSMIRPNVIQAGELTLEFCGKSESTPGLASETHLPVMIFHCPEDFSTVEYFENLTTRQIGRIGIYAPIMTSSMLVVSNLTLAHGFMVISRYQTKGKGRSNNQWLSPPGCAMFSLQLHIPMGSALGQRLPVVQHLVAISVVSAILSLPGYEKLDIGLKWPNDIYGYGASKLGGSISNTVVDASTAIVNIGVGINLSNSKPTLCVNDMIAQYNAKHSTALPLLSYEKTFALIFNKLEELYDRVQREGISSLQKEYYRLWLHQDAEIGMVGTAGESLQGTIVGIDEYGFLLVKKQPSGEIVTVHPDGNSFDMMQGLIIPKFT